MLPGYSFNPRPNNSANGTADSVMDIGSSINGYYVMIDKFILLCKFYIKTVHIDTLFTLTRLNVSLIKELSFWKRSIFFLRDEACLESIKGRQSISVLWLKKQGKNCYSKAQEYDLVFLTALGSRFSTHARHAFVHWKLNLVARVFSFSNMTPFCEPRRPWGRGCWRPHDLLVLVSNTTSSRRIVLRSGTAAQLPLKILFFSRLLPKCTLINLSARNIQIFTN